MGGDGDDKYEKIARQEATFRSRLGWTVLVLLVLIGVFLLEDVPKKDAEEYLQRAERSAEDYLQRAELSAVHAAEELLRGGGAKGGLAQNNPDPAVVGKEEEHLRGTDTAAGAAVQENKVATGADPAKVQPEPDKVQTTQRSISAGEEKSLENEVRRLDQEVRKIKSSLQHGKEFMETDPRGVDASKRLQEATRKLLHARYGESEPYRVRVELEFQPTNPTFEREGADGTLLLEMAPSRLQPHSIFTFMEISRQWKGGAFHRLAPHVLQVMVRGGFDHLAFQEYSPEWPHEKGTVGYAGRPSGPAWYVSIQNNVRNHGPGSQQKANPQEADSCFGKVIEGFENVVPRIQKMDNKMGFINDQTKHTKIKDMKVMVPDSNGKYIDWTPQHG